MCNETIEIKYTFRTFFDNCIYSDIHTLIGKVDFYTIMAYDAILL